MRFVITQHHIFPIDLYAAAVELKKTWNTIDESSGARLEMNVRNQINIVRDKI